MSHLPPLRVELDSRVTPAPLTDSFDRANSTNTLGNSWTVHNGTWGISANQAYVSVVAGFQNLVTRDLGWSSGTVAADCSGAECGLLVRSVDAGTYLQVIVHPSGFLELTKWASGITTPTVLHTSGTGLAVAGRMSVTMDGSRLTASYGGVEFIRYFLTSAEMTTYGAATRHGIRLGNTTARLDNFSATAKQADDSWTTPPSWVRIDLTNGLREYHNRRIGAPNAWTKPVPSELILRLANANGYLDPSNTASPYLALLTRDRQLRVVYDDGVTSFTKAHGLVERWPVQWTSTGADAETELLVIDRLGALERARMPPSLVEHELAKGTKYPRPTHLYAFRESNMGPGGEYLDAIGSVNGTPVGAPPKALGENLVPYSAPGGIESGTSDGGYVTFPLSLLPTINVNANFTVIAVIRSQGLYRVFKDGTPGLSNSLQMAIENRSTTYPLGLYELIMRDESLNQAEALKALANIGDGAPHMLTMTYHTDDRLYGHYDKTAIGSIPFEDPAPAVGAYYVGIGDPNTKASLGLLIAWDRTVFDPEKNAIYDGIFTPWATDGMAQRMPNILGIVAPGVSFVHAASSTQNFLPVNFSSRSPLELISGLVVDYVNSFWATRDGTLKLIGLANIPAVLRTYGPGAGQTPYRSVSVRQQTEAITSVTYTNEAGNTITVGNLSGTGLAVDDAPLKANLLRGNAQRLLNLAAAEAAPGVDSMTLLPAHPDVDWAQTLRLDLYDRLNVAVERPWGIGTETTTREVCTIFEDATTKSQWTTKVGFRRPVL